MSVRAEISGLSVRFGAVEALRSVELTVEAGQFLALLGPSGSGKTTMLNVLAGFVRPDTGTVAFDGVDVTDVPPHQRDLGIVFQGYALFPNMSVAGNVAFPLRMRRLSHAERERRVQEALAMVGLDQHAKRSVTTLSGGQKQRVALARAIVFEPRMMLLDEPLAALDKQLREAMQLEIRRLQQRIRITTVAVTHDQTEALTMADVVAVMRDGEIEQVAGPEALYLRPATLFVASFLGEANLVRVDRGDLCGFGRLETSVSGQAVIRPEHLTLVNDPVGAGNLRAEALVEDVTFQGPRRRARLRLCSAPDITLTLSQASVTSHGPVTPGDTVEVALDVDAVHVIPDEPRRVPETPTSHDNGTRSDRHESATAKQR